MAASLQERLLEKRRQRTEKPVEIPISGFADGCLVGLFRTIEDWEQLRNFSYAQAEADAAGEARAAAAAIAQQCVKLIGTDGDERQEYEPPFKSIVESFGLNETYKPEEWAGIDEWEAVLIFLPSDADAVGIYLQLRGESEKARSKTDKAIEGESPAS